MKSPLEIVYERKEEERRVREQEDVRKPIHLCLDFQETHGATGTRKSSQPDYNTRTSPTHKSDFAKTTKTVSSGPYNRTLNATGESKWKTRY